MVDQCTRCGHTRRVYWQKYKPRGRKKGIRNPKEPPKNCLTLDHFIGSKGKKKIIAKKPKPEEKKEEESEE